TTHSLFRHVRTHSSILFPYPTLFRSPGCPELVPARESARYGQNPAPPRSAGRSCSANGTAGSLGCLGASSALGWNLPRTGFSHRSEEHTSELQSRENIVCRLLSEKKT